MKKKSTGLKVATKTIKRSTSSPAKRRKRSSRKGLLSDMMNPTIATNGAKSSLAAVGGGYASIQANKMIPSSWGTGARLVVAVGLGFLGHTVLGAPNLSSGFVGGMVAQNNPTTMLRDADFVDDDMFEDDEPQYLSESGERLYLADDGQFYLMDDE